MRCPDLLTAGARWGNLSFFDSTRVLGFNVIHPLHLEIPSTFSRFNNNNSNTRAALEAQTTTIVVAPNLAGVAVRNPQRVGERRFLVQSLETVKCLVPFCTV